MRTVDPLEEPAYHRAVAPPRNRKYRPSFSSNQAYRTTFRRNTEQHAKKKGSIGKVLKVITFWVLFGLLMSCLFLINRERIQNTIKNAHFPLWFSKNVQLVQNKPPVPQEEKPPLFVERPEAQALPQTGEEQVPLTLTTQESPMEESPSPETGVPAAFPVSNAVPMTLAPARPSIQEVPISRSLYFIQLDAEGTILHSPVSRSLPNSDTPLEDAVKALLDGPSLEEQQQGLISLIPSGTNLLSLMIRLETAYINLSEDFLYTPYGSEAYTAQLQQLVWTATEFPTIKDVQLLIEGKKLDYLGDITWIGSPIGRDAF
jgi:spore germination protein GerM